MTEFNEYFELINQRQSCRKYAAVPLEQHKFIACVESGRIAPSAYNAQPWHFYAVNDQAVSAQVALALQDKGMNKYTSACPAFIVITEDNGSFTSAVGAKAKDQDFKSIDIGIAAAHIILAASAQGLGSCAIGWFNEDNLRETLSIPKSRRVRLVIAIGYADNEPPRKKSRKSLKGCVTFISK